jgi:hypothetical protein
MPVASKTKDFFSSAKPVAKPSAKSNSKVDNRIPVAGLAALAGAGKIVKAAKAVEMFYKAQVYEQSRDYFVNQVKLTKSKPPTSFNAVEGEASGNLQFKRRSSVSVLKEAEREMLDEHNLPYEVEEIFSFNPSILSDPKKREALNKALSTWKDCPADLIVKQERCLVTEDTMITAAKNPKVFAEVVDVIGCLAVKAQTRESLVDILDNLRDELVKQEEAKEEDG